MTLQPGASYLSLLRKGKKFAIVQAGPTSSTSAAR
jgi:hypothetical protein